MAVIVDSLPVNTNMSGIDPFVDGQSAISPFSGLGGLKTSETKAMATGPIVNREFSRFQTV